MRILIAASIAGAVLLFVACQQPVEKPHPIPHASVQELMQMLVDPSADAIWESVQETVTAAGTESTQPQNDAEWLALRQHALRLIEAANLLQLEGRAVARPGATLEDAHVEGISKPAEIEASIARNPASFARAAQGLQKSSLDTLAAIDARDLPALLKAGAELDAACERCHVTYWYPGAKTPIWPAPLKTTTSKP